MVPKLTQAHNDFLHHGHGLSNSNWSAWWCAYQYAAEVDSPLLPLIDKGCDYAEKMKPIPNKYLKAAERLFHDAVSAKAAALN
jgi:hypothetical protein